MDEGGEAKFPGAMPSGGTIPTFSVMGELMTSFHGKSLGVKVKQTNQSTVIGELMTSFHGKSLGIKVKEATQSI